jgi:5-azacytidine-induced protein 1
VLLLRGQNGEDITKVLVHRQEMATEQAKQHGAVDAQRKESEMSMQRHLDLIDRLLADKDTLAQQVHDLQEGSKAREEKHSKTLDALKQGWVQELRQQKEAWAAADKVRPPAKHFCLWHIVCPTCCNE